VSENEFKITVGQTVLKVGAPLERAPGTFTRATTIWPLLDKSGFVKDCWPVEERRDHEARIFAHIGSDIENLPHIEENSEVFYPLKDIRAAAKESSQATRETHRKHFGENNYTSNNNAWTVRYYHDDYNSLLTQVWNCLPKREYTTVTSLRITF
jgi:hypothetical protein